MQRNGQEWRRSAAYTDASLVFLATGQTNPGTPPRLRSAGDYVDRGRCLAMRQRLRKFLPIVLFALTVQILAPIAACWAAAIAASDPGCGRICHGSPSLTRSSDGDHPQDVQRGCCTLCGTLHADAPIDVPPPAAGSSLYQGHDGGLARVLARPGRRPCRFPEQARAPPALS